MHKNNIENITEGQFTKSNFKSPTYNVSRVNIVDIIGQYQNPNAMTSKSFGALQISIKNTGYSFPIVVVQNPLFDESSIGEMSEYSRIVSVITGGKGDTKSGTGSSDTFATQVSDEEIRKMFPYQIADGQQRSSVIRLGTKYFMDDPNAERKAEEWSKGENIPTDPGREMLKFLAWRENFTLPCVILEGKSEVELMSVTVLMNQARGAHSLDSMKDIVYNLINVAGMSEDWIARNLFLDPESVKRMNQLAGLKSAYDNLAEADLAWDPVEDGSYERKQNAYLNREASKYVTEYIEKNPDVDQGQNRDIGNIQDYAESLGWDRDAAIKVKQSDVKVAPNGTRRESRIQVGHIPK